MKRSRRTTVAALAVLGFVLPPGTAQADLLTLRSGVQLQGDFQGASPRVFLLQVDGRIRQIPVAEVQRLELSTRPGAEQAPPLDARDLPRYLILGSGPAQSIELRPDAN